MKIDLVYTWVDGGSPDFQRTIRTYAGTTQDLNPERFRDLFHLLKYSLRSVERFAPWVGTVFLVTQRPQVPCWLNTAHPRLRVVHHDEIFEHAEYLPTFSSPAIESYLHRVPASDYFVYFNDDCLFGRSTVPEDFVTADGRIKVLGTKRMEHWKARLLSLMVLRAQVSHAPLVVYRPYWRAMVEQYASEIEPVRRRRFRTKDGASLVDLYRTFLVSDRTLRRAVVPAHQVARLHRPHNIRNFYGWQRLKLASLRMIRPKFFCMNDDQGDVPNPRVVTLVKTFLERYYPEPSAFERTP